MCLPDRIGNCIKLTSLVVSRNPLRSFPSCIAGCTGAYAADCCIGMPSFQLTRSYRFDKDICFIMQPSAATRESSARAETAGSGKQSIGVHSTHDPHIDHVEGCFWYYRFSPTLKRILQVLSLVNNPLSSLPLVLGIMETLPDEGMCRFW